MFHKRGPFLPAAVALDYGLEALASVSARLCVEPPEPDEGVRSIFVLRNNDLGDVMLCTPLFEALRRMFPSARIVAGVGDWAAEVLRGNPHVDEVLVVNAPWNNKYCRRRSIWDALRFIYTSEAARRIRRHRFDIGIDVLGSHFGSLLLVRARIRRRLGVRGYAGGHRSSAQHVSFDPSEHVARASLRFAELLGARRLPEPRPRIYLDDLELSNAERFWSEHGSGRIRLVIGPGSGNVAKYWPAENYAELARRLGREPGIHMAIVGGASDRAVGGDVAAAAGDSATNLCGTIGIRQTLALVARSDGVICNGSMLMHAAAAFRKPTAVLLGPAYHSAQDHQVQWGYAETCHQLGPDREHGGIWSPDEVYKFLLSMIRANRTEAT